MKAKCLRVSTRVSLYILQLSFKHTYLKQPMCRAVGHDKRNSQGHCTQAYQQQH